MITLCDEHTVPRCENATPLHKYTTPQFVKLLLACIDVEEVISGHAGLPGHASWDDHQITAIQGFRQLLSTREAANLAMAISLINCRRETCHVVRNDDLSSLDNTAGSSHLPLIR